MSERSQQNVVSRPNDPAHRVTVQNIVDWQSIRARHDEYAADPQHMLLHLMKCLGPISDVLEHRDHAELEREIDDKRYADLIISAVWLVRAMEKDPSELVANRIWDIGIRPKRDELPPSERDGSKEPKP